MTKFELTKAIRKGSSNKYERLYLDFCLGGQTVFRADVERRDLCSVLWIDPPVPEERDNSVLRLLKELPGDLPNDRVSLYICPECGDIGCGSITAKISINGDEVVWSEFGYEKNYEDSVLMELFAARGSFSFDRFGYEAKLRDLIAQHR
jgi:hypothetical protein